MQRVGVGIIGLGMAVKPHALALRDLADQVDVIGGYSPTPERRSEFARSYGLPAVDSLDALLGDARVGGGADPDPAAHPRGAGCARRARRASTCCWRSPSTSRFSRPARWWTAVEREGRKLGVVFQYRFRPGTVTLRKLLREGALGELLSVSCAVRWWRPAEYYAQPGRGMRARDGGGVLLTQSIHTLDVLLDLAGPVKRVSAQCRTSPLRSIDTEDIACAAVEYRNGAVGVVDATTVAYPGYPERIDLAGTKGSAVLEAERLVVHRSGQDALHVDGSSAGGGGADPMAFSHEPHRRLIEDFLDAVRTGREPRSSGRSALAVHALIDAMLESSASGRAVEVAAE